MMFPITNVR